MPNKHDIIFSLKSLGLLTPTHPQFWIRSDKAERKKNWMPSLIQLKRMLPFYLVIPTNHGYSGDTQINMIFS